MYLYLYYLSYLLYLFTWRLPIAIDVSVRTGGWWSHKPRLSHGSVDDFTNTTMWHSQSFVFVSPLYLYFTITTMWHSQSFGICICLAFLALHNLLFNSVHLHWFKNIIKNCPPLTFCRGFSNSIHLSNWSLPNSLHLLNRSLPNCSMFALVCKLSFANYADIVLLHS